MKKNVLVELINHLKNQSGSVVITTDGLVDEVFPEIQITGDSYLVKFHFIKGKAIISSLFNDSDGKDSQKWLNACWKTMLKNKNQRDIRTLKVTSSFCRQIMSKNKPLQEKHFKKKKNKISLIKNRFFVSENTGVTLLKNYSSEAY